MRTSHRNRRVRPAHRSALAAALALAFAPGAYAGNINVPGPITQFTSLAQAINTENTKYSQSGGTTDCTGDTITIAAGFVTADSAPLPPVQCPGLAIVGNGSYPVNMSGISGANSFMYGGCGLTSYYPVVIQNIEITGFSYGSALCGQFSGVYGNYIHGNGGGIEVWSGARAPIGGTKSTQPNHIFDNASASGYGVFVEYGGAADIVDNYIGTDGTIAAPNGTGVLASGATNVTVDGNVLGESTENIVLEGSGSATNNFIGVNASGNNLGAGQYGVIVQTIDPTVSVTGNTIANMQFGVMLQAASGGQVGGNTIGSSSASGTQFSGITVFCSSGVQITGNTVTGQQDAGVLLADASSTTLDSNSITANGGDGVAVSTGCGVGRMPLAAASKRTAHSPIVALQTASSGLTFTNNDISGNGSYGIDFVYGGMSSNDLVRGNTISNNAFPGVEVGDPASVGIAIVGNAVFGNGTKNIELAAGANEGIATPQIQSVVQNGTNTVVTYQLNNASGTPHDYTVEFFTNPSAGAPAATTFQAQAYQAGVTGVQTFTQTFTGSLDNFSLTSTQSTAPGAWVETSELSPIGVATVVAPPVTFTPALTDFGAIYVNQTSGVRTITATNGTAKPIAVSAPSVTPPFIIRSTDCGASIAPQSSCSVDVVFAPSQSGFATGTLAVGAFTAQLSGTGLDAPILDVTGLIDFGPYIVGTTALTRTATVTNNGTAVITFNGISVSGPFGLSHDCPIDLRPGQSCTLTVTFSSSTLGTAAGAITLRSNALGGDHTIALGALVQARPVPVIEIHPEQLTFGNGLIGRATPSMRVIVGNSGGVDATLGSMTATRDYIVVSTTCTTTLAPQSSCTVDVALRPIGFGSRPGSLSFTSNADGSPHHVGLGGMGCRSGASSNRGGTTDPCAP